VPFLLFSVWSGALADRYDPRRMIQIGLVVFALVSVAWGLLFLSGTLEMWHAVVLLVFHGVAGVIWSPAAQLYIHEIVEAPQLPSAIRLLATARWLGLLMGPGVGGLILLTLGPTWGILFNALIYVPFFLWLLRAPFEHKPHPPSVRGLADLKIALQATVANPVILAMMLLVGGASLIVGNAYQAQMPEFAHDLGHADGGLTYSLLFGADAAGAFTAGILLETRALLRPSPRTAVLLAMGWCVAMAGFALNQWYPLALVLLFVCGFLELSFYAMAQALVQINAPAEVRGRVIGLFAMSALGLRAFSGVTVGIGGALIGIHLSLALSAGLLFMVFLILVTRTKPVL
jgi:MFS family permease